MKLRTALYDGHTELVTQEELEAASTFVGATVGGSAGDLLVSDGLGNADAFTAGAGEVVFVDGSNHAATSADLKFDDVTNTLKVYTISGVPTDGLLLYGDAGVSNTKLALIDGATAAERSLELGCTNGRVLITNEKAEFAGLFSIITHTIDTDPVPGSIKFTTDLNVYPYVDNAVTFGADDGGAVFGRLAWAMGHINAVQGAEITTPTAPVDGQGILYFKAAGGGKTGLYVLFPSGAEQQIKVEA